jgi:hypothetical protein
MTSVLVLTMLGEILAPQLELPLLRRCHHRRPLGAQGWSIVDVRCRHFCGYHSSIIFDSELLVSETKSSESKMIEL